MLLLDRKLWIGGDIHAKQVQSSSAGPPKGEAATPMVSSRARGVHEHREGTNRFREHGLKRYRGKGVGISKADRIENDVASKSGCMRRRVFFEIRVLHHREDASLSIKCTNSKQPLQW